MHEKSLDTAITLSELYNTNVYFIHKTAIKINMVLNITKNK